MRSTTKTRVVGQVVLGLSMVAVLGACGSGSSDTAGPTPSSSPVVEQRPSGPATTPAVTAPPPGTPAADQSTGVAAGQTYTVRKVTVSNGIGKTDVAESLELSGGDPRVAEVFNGDPAVVRGWLAENAERLAGPSSAQQQTAGASA